MQLLNVEVDKWEIALDRVILQEVIGRGAFGAVWRTLLSEPDGKPGNRTVAAKCFTRKIMYMYEQQDELRYVFSSVLHKNSTGETNVMVLNLHTLMSRKLEKLYTWLEREAL